MKTSSETFTKVSWKGSGDNKRLLSYKICINQTKNKIEKIGAAGLNEKGLRRINDRDTSRGARRRGSRLQLSSDSSANILSTERTTSFWTFDKCFWIEFSKMISPIRTLIPAISDGSRPISRTTSPVCQCAANRCKNSRNPLSASVAIVCDFVS